MMRHIFLIVFLILISFSLSFAQRGKDGAKTVTAANTIVNEYTTLTADAAAGATTITVANSSLNTNSRFSGSLAPGDLIMVIQLQGATIQTGVQSKQWGKVLNYNNCGLYEFEQVLTVPNSTTITIECGLINSYTSLGKVEVIRVPRYSSLTVNSGGSITGDAWSGSSGGILAVEVLGATTINSGGTMDMSGKGFRGGILNDDAYWWGVDNYYWPTNDYGAEKGEGIAGYETDYDAMGGRYCRGAAANGGGGANTHNHGGGGGANAGDTTLWTGKGNPDASQANWITAWNLESVGFATSTSTGGGRGGYSFSSSNQNAITTAPGNTSWSGDNRNNYGGFGGRPLDYSTGRIYLGGGGGAGEQNDTKGTSGAKGGGIIYIQSYGTITGAGQIISNGAAAANSTSGNGVTTTGADGAGGGGAGGTIILRSIGTVSGISTTANGGAGGNQVINGMYSTYQAEGPGGGGGGGYIAISGGAITRTANGGANGTTNSAGLSEFPPNGATKGGAGINNASISYFYIVAPNDTICTGTAATLTATLMGIVPPGTTIYWYDAIVGGNVLATGPTFTTPALTTTTTYYVGTCQGTYHQPVTVYINTAIANAGTDATICSGQSSILHGTGGGTYSWGPSTGLSNSNIANPVASPTATTTYTLTVTSTAGCTASDQVVITVNGTINANAGPDVSICPGSSTNLSATGGITYAWSPALGLSSTTISNPVADPTITTSYIVTVTNASGCTDADTVVVTVLLPVIANAGSDTTLCFGGGSAQLHASGGTIYAWSPATGLSNANISNPLATPASTATYIVTVTNANGCTGTDDVVVNVAPNLAVSVTPSAPSTCPGGSVVLTANGGTTYSWAPAASLSSSSGATVTASPSSTTIYTVTATNASGCTGSVNVTVTIGSNLNVTVTPSSPTLCTGNTVQLNASGATNYIWSPSTGLSGTTGATVTANPTSTSNYTVSGTDGAGCSGTASVTVTVNTGVTLSVTPSSPSICIGGNIVLTATGGTSYTWSPAIGLSGTTGATVTANPSSTTIYSVTATNANGCLATANVTVTVGATLTPTVTPTSPSVCIGGSVVLTASGGTTYSWAPATGLSSTTGATVTANPASTTIYTVTVTNASGCTGSTSVTVTVGSNLNITVTPNAAAICPGASVQLSASGATNYTWSPAAGLSGTTGTTVTANPNATATYIINGSDASGCSGSTTVTISVSPLTAIASSTNENCGQANGSVTVTAGGTCVSGFAYQWNTVPQQTTQTVNNISAGNYAVTVTCGACSVTATALVTNVAGPSATVTNVIAATCGQVNGSASISPVGGSQPYTYHWSNGQTGPTLAAVAAGTYTVTVQDANNCSAVNTVTIPNSAGPTLTVTNIVDASCFLSNGSATISASGGTPPYSYTWSSIPVQTGQNLQNAAAGNYNVTVSDASGCSTITSVTIGQTGGLIVTATSSDEDCNLGNGTITVNASQGTGSYSYMWSTSPVQTSNTVTGLTAGTYTVTVSDGVCSVTTSVTVNISPGPTALFSAHPNIVDIYNSDVSFIDHSTGNIVNWQWNFGDGTPVGSGESVDHTFGSIGIYYVTLTITDNNGCTDIYIDTIHVNDIFALYIPNTFSPNDDGINDLFLPKGLSVDPDNFNMAIYNRWGNIVFETSKWGEGWNGTYKNQGDPNNDVIMDVYVYRIRCKDLNGQKHQYIGRVTLLP
jgi:gliding motility-associated-like protein